MAIGDGQVVGPCVGGIRFVGTRNECSLRDTKLCWMIGVDKNDEMGRSGVVGRLAFGSARRYSSFADWRERVATRAGVVYRCVVDCAVENRVVFVANVSGMMVLRKNNRPVCVCSGMVLINLFLTKGICCKIGFLACMFSASKKQARPRIFTLECFFSAMSAPSKFRGLYVLTFLLGVRVVAWGVMRRILCFEVCIL